MTEHLEIMLPDWASKTTDEYELFAVLPTRDGRRAGNSIIFDITKPDYMNNRLVYHVCTDAGNILILIEEELVELYHPPKYVAKAPMFHLRSIIDGFRKQQSTRHN